MLFIHFINHQWKQATRSSIWQKSLALNLIIGFFAFIILLQAMVMAALLARNWHNIVESDAVLFEFYKVVGWYFAGMFAFRFFMQQTPVMAIQPYQHLNIPRTSLVHFVLIKGAFNFFNLLTLVFFVPFATQQVSYYHGGTLAFLWLLGLICLDLFFNYITIYLKKQMITGLKVILWLIAGLTLLALGDILGWYSYANGFALALEYIMHTPVLLLIPALMLAMAYRLNYRYLKSHFYLEDNTTVKESRQSGTRLTYLERFGLIGEVMIMDVRLFLRNKRTKTIIYLAPVFLLYGLFFYLSDQYAQDDGFMVFVGIFMTGGIMFNYLQHAFAFEGSYWDLLLTSRIDFRDYIRAKFMGGSILTIAAFILILPYLYFGWFILLINTATFLFNLGIVLPMLIYIATYNTKSLDLSKGTAFNFQGVGGMHFLTMVPVFIMPLFLYLPFKWFGNPDYGVYLIGLVGLLGLALKRVFIEMIHKNLQSRKYIMAGGFREKG